MVIEEENVNFTLNSDRSFILRCEEIDLPGKPTCALTVFRLPFGVLPQTDAANCGMVGN